MNKNPLLQIQEFGQSIWLDFIRREIITSGELKQLIDEDGLRGVTSNPAIFEKAIGESDDYSSEIRALVSEGKSAEKIYETIAVEDIQQAADEFRPTFDALDGRDGFVSLEVSPLLARDTESTIEEARRLWSELNRPNVFIKVPATKEGLPAIKQLISEGINVNVTLLFGLDRYREVADAYISGLEDADRSGKSLSRIASVASFFLSRIDVLADPMLERLVDKTEKARGLVGEVAIASAKIAYQIYQEIYSTDRWRKLADKGARKQRLLWASTSTKNPDYKDVKYVEPLIGSDTINTLPKETLEAYRNHGRPAARLAQHVDKAQKVLDTLAEVGIDLKQVTQKLEDDGIEKFANPFNKLLTLLEKRSEEIVAERSKEQVAREGRSYDGNVRM